MAADRTVRVLAVDQLAAAGLDPGPVLRPPQHRPGVVAVQPLLLEPGATLRVARLAEARGAQRRGPGVGAAARAPLELDDHVLRPRHLSLPCRRRPACRPRSRRPARAALARRPQA